MPCRIGALLCLAPVLTRRFPLEQEVQSSIRSAQTLLKQEKKRRESLEKRFQKAQDERIELQVRSEAA